MPRKTVPVVCVETGVMYESITEAAETLGLNTSSISHAIRRGNGLHGHHFKYADEGRNRPIVTDKRYKQVPVTCVETGRVYESLKSAAMANGTTVGNISSAINTGGRARGLHFQIADEKPVDRRIACLETGEVFESIEEVEQELFDGRSGDEVGRAVRTGESVRGYHFYRADAPKPEPSFFGMKDWRCVEEKKVREPKSDAPHSLDDVGKTVLEALGVGIKDIDLDGLREFIARNAGEIKGERADGSETKTRDVLRETVSLKQTVRESREASAELSKKNTYTDGPSGKDEH